MKVKDMGIGDARVLIMLKISHLLRKCKEALHEEKSTLIVC
jgi:hypothetical protein